MVRQIYFFIVIFFAAFFSTIEGYSQCLSISTINQPTNCYGGNDGQIILTIVGAPPNAQPPWNVELFFEDSGGGLTTLASYIGVNTTSFTFTPGNGSLNVIGADAFGIPANDFIDPGSRYRIEVRASGSGVFTCKNKISFSTITQPTELVATVNTITPACTPGTGAITLDVIGGTPLTGGPPNYLYTWTLNGGTTAITVEDPTNLAAGTYSVTITDDNGCTDIISNIVVLDQPTISLGANPSVCTGTTSASLTYISTSGSPTQYRIDWNAGGPPDVPLTALPASPIPITGIPLTVATYTGTLFVSSAICESVGNPISVTVNPSPTSAVLSGTTSICTGSSTNLIVTITGGTSPYSITIDNGVGTISNYVSGTPIPVSPLATTTYSMVGNVSDAAGCNVAGSGSGTITVNPPPTSAVLSGLATICSGTSTNLSVTITGGASPYSITIDNGVGTINNYVSGTPIPVSPLATTTYSMVGNVSDAAGCNVAGSGSGTITVNPPPTSAVLSGLATICSGTSTNLSVTITGGASPYTITIDNGVGTINNYVSGTPIPVNPLATTTYSMVGNVSDAAGCNVAGSGSGTITVNPPPTSAVLSGTTSICTGSSTNLIVTITGGASPYSITIDNGVGTISNYVSGTPIPVNPLATTTYSMVGNVSDAAGCNVAGSGSGTITVNPPPTSAVLSGTTSICTGSSTNLIVTITGGTSPYSIAIDNGVGTISNYVSGTPIPVSPLATTTYSMVGNVSDAAGCNVAGSGSGTITVNPPPTSAVLSGLATICSGTSTNLSVTITGGASPYTITIDNGVGTISNYVSGTPIPVSPLATTTYSMVGNVSDAAGCNVAGSGSGTITVNPPPTSAVLSGLATICSGTSTNLSVTITGGASPYSITIDNGVGTINNYVSGTPIPVSPLATTTYSMVGNVSDAAGCNVAGSGSGTITVNPPPTSAVLSGLATICSGTSTNLSVTITGGASPYTITIDNGVGTINNYVSGTPIPVNPLATTTYSMVGNVSDAAGCNVAGSGSGTITVNPPPTSAVLSGTTSICTGSSTNLIVTITGGTSPYTITIDNGVGTISNYVSGTPIPISPLATTTYSMVGNVSDAAGCNVAGSGSAIITVNTTPNAGANNTVSACDNNSSFDLFTSLGGTPDAGGTWSQLTGTTTVTITVNNANLSGAVAGPYTFQYSVTGTGPCANATAVVIVNVVAPPSIALTLSSSIATVCTGGISDVLVTNSEPGVSYQLRNNADNSSIGSSVLGTGSLIALSTGVLGATTTFNVLATNVCTAVQLSATATVTVSGTVNASLAVTPLSSVICSGSATSIQIDNSESGVSYQLRNDFDDSLIGTAVSGTGGTINLPTNTITAATTYNILANNGSCQIELTNLATVNIQPDPNSSLTVTAVITTLCSGGNTTITIDNSETGVSYQLRNDSNDSPVGSSIVGNGATISLPTGSLAGSTVFNILATGLCTSVELVNKSTITVAGAVNQNLAVTSPTSSVCEGTTSMVQIVNSEVGVNYQLRNDSDDSIIGTSVAGTGTTINLPTSALSAATTFNVLASTGTCSVELTNKVTISTIVAPNTAITVSSSTTCFGVDTSVDLASEVGVIYQLRLDTDDSLVGAAIIGNGSLAKIHVDAPTSTTTYNILATRASCSIELTTLATVTVLPANDPQCVTGGGGGTGTCATVIITALSSPATCNTSNGTISFGVSPAVPVLNTVGVRITVVGTSASNLGVAFTNSNDNFFINNVPRGSYDYTIVYGDLSCVKTGKVTVAKVGGVADPVASNIVEPLCFGDPSGSVKIDVAGETGNTLQWSLDATNWKNFVAGGLITGIPSGPAPTFQYTISVRKNASDICFGGVSITMKGPLSALDTLSTKKTISQPDLPTGSLLVDIIESGEAPYEGRLELIHPLFTGQTFAQDWTTITRNTLNLKYEINFAGLYAGTYQLSLRDGLGCTKNYSIVIGVDTNISLPNIFTPNGDGVNEVFYIRNLPADSQLIISNRWGTEVYSSKNYQNDWNGGSTTDGVYYYKLLASGQSFTGWIEILRGK